MILPALTLAFRPIGRIAQVTRGAMLDEMSKPYVVTARSKGLAERVCTFGHGFRNAAIPIVTMCGDETASLLNGAVIIETVFGWPGLGVVVDPGDWPSRLAADRGDGARDLDHDHHAQPAGGPAVHTH